MYTLVLYVPLKTRYPKWKEVCFSGKFNWHPSDSSAESKNSNWNWMNPLNFDIHFVIHVNVLEMHGKNSRSTFFCAHFFICSMTYLWANAIIFPLLQWKPKRSCWRRRRGKCFWLFAKLKEKFQPSVQTKKFPVITECEFYKVFQSKKHWRMFFCVWWLFDGKHSWTQGACSV